MSCTYKIKEGISNFTGTEKKLAEYILENKDITIKCSAQELADRVGVSAAAVVRFAKRLGYKGFTAFKVELAKTESEEEEEDKSVIIQRDDKLKDIVRKVGTVNRNIIDETIKLMNIDVLEEAVKAILDGRNIYLYGIGASGLVAMDLHYKLSRINITTIYNYDSHVQLTTAVNIKKDDVAIGISYSGETKEIALALKKAKENGAKIIGITKYAKSTISKISDINLYLPSQEKELRIGAISSRASALLVTDILFLSVARERFDKTEQSLVDTRKIINELKL